MKLLTKGHAVVARAASTDETRYILNGVYLEETEKGMKATATDGKMLATVEDESIGFTALDYPANVIPATAPNGAKTAIVPTDVFVSAFKGLPGRKSRLPVLQNVAVTMGATETTLGTTDLATPIVRTARNIEGTFPNYKQIIPKKSTFAIKFDPKLLGVALKIAQDFELTGVDMEFTDNKSPVKITGKRNGQTLTVVVMPLQPDRA